MTQTTTMTIRINKATAVELAKAAAQEKRSKSFLAAEAVQHYLDIRQAQIEGIKKAISSIETHGTVPHAEVKAWVDSWGTNNELPMPQPKLG